MKDFVSADLLRRFQPLMTMPLVGFGLRWLHRMAAVEIVDRSMGLAARFVASLIPLVIVVDAVNPYQDDPRFWDSLGRWLGLRGASQRTVQELIGSGGTLTVSLSWVGTAVLLYSAFSFVRALQRAYERAWGLKPLGFKNLARHVIWLVILVGVVWGGYLLRAFSGRAGQLSVLVEVLGSLLALGWWWLTSYLLLGGRIDWRALLPGAVLTWLAVVAYGVISALYLPQRIDSSARQFGPIGLLFVVLSWYFILFLLVIAGAAFGPVLMKEDHPIAHTIRGESPQRQSEDTLVVKVDEPGL